MVSNTDEPREEAHILTLEQFGLAEDSQDNTSSPSTNVKSTPTTTPPDEIEQTPQTQGPAPASMRRIYLMVLADFGLAFTWLCKFAVATPYFQHSLKAGPILSHLVWIMGPLSGLIVAPMVGVLSDRCTSSFGRRRPFMLGGTIFCIIGMQIFANARKIAFGYLPAARVIAVLAFGVLDFATNAIMFPSRALLGDLLPAEQQHPVQSAAAVTASLAEIIGGAYIYSWKDPVTHISTIFTVASVLLAISSGVSLFVCKEKPMTKEELAEKIRLDVEMKNMGDTAEVARPKEEDVANTDNVVHEAMSNGSIEREGNQEDQIDTGRREQSSEVAAEQRLNIDEGEEIEDDDDVEQRLAIRVDERNTEQGPESFDDAASVERASVWGELSETVKTTVMQFPQPLVKVGIVYGLAWFVWFASLPFYSQWIGVDVLQGDPHAAAGSNEANLYQQGVSIFSLANVAKALLAMIFSAFYPRIIAWVGSIGERVVFGGSFFVFSSALFACAYTKNAWVAGGVIALGSVPFIVTQTIPIAIVVQRYPENLASNLGVLNLFCVIPQLVDTLYTGKVAELAGESAVLRVAAGWGFATSVAAFFFL